mgnify:CR=1 FL=1
MIALSVYAVFALIGLVCILGARVAPARLPALAAGAVHALSLAVIVLAATAQGLVFDAPTYLGDLWTAFDAIGKAHQGARSSIDYFNPIGPVYEWGLQAALAVREPSASVLPLANAMIGALALGAAVLMLAGRVSALTVALTGLIAVSVAVSPRDSDTLFVQGSASFLAPYNRWGWALFVPVMCFFAAPIKARDIVGAVVAGGLIALMLLLKPTYGLAALGMVAVSAVLQRGRWRDAAIAVGAMLVVLAALQVLTGQVSGYLSDLGETARMDQTGLRWIKLLYQLAEVGLFLLIALLVFYIAQPRDAPWPSPYLWRPLLLILAVGGAGWMVMMQNHHATEAAVYLLMPLLAAEWSGLLRAGATAQVSRSRIGWVLLIFLVTLARPLTDSGFVLAQNAQLARLDRDTHLAGGYMHDLIVHRRWRRINDYQRMLSGLELLRANGADVADAGTVLALNFSNPFPFLLGRPAPSGVPIWTHIGRSISERQHPPAGEFFDGVDYLMLARGELSGEAVADIYRETIAAEFEEQDDDAYWRLFVRRE